MRGRAARAGVSISVTAELFTLFRKQGTCTEDTVRADRH